MYYAPLSDLQNAAAKIQWHKLADASDDITNIKVHGDDLYLLSHHEASRYKVLHTRFPNPNVAAAEMVIPAGASVIQNIAAAQDALYVQSLDGGIGRLARLPYAKGAKVESINLPFEGAISELTADPLSPGAVFCLTSWTKNAGSGNL